MEINLLLTLGIEIKKTLLINTFFFLLNYIFVKNKLICDTFFKVNSSKIFLEISNPGAMYNKIIIKINLNIILKVIFVFI